MRETYRIARDDFPPAVGRVHESVDGWALEDDLSWISIPSKVDTYVAGLGDFDDNGFIDVVWHTMGTDTVSVRMVTDGEATQDVALPEDHPNIESSLGAGWVGRNESDVVLVD